ncbi:MAG TPA: FAD-dependent oxidoreductase, partial [Thermoplasmata archaeon]|nr:FAD-dependent oxidoreductase [Thermoplasmata archaeon]
MSEEFSARTRAANLAAMAREPVDVLVIGGGIVGAWTALTAAMGGHRTALVEKGDFASGTSGKTSRLIHGGLRYLQQLRIRVVRRAARERDLLLKIAPGLVKPLTFLIPVYRDRGPKKWQLRIGLWLYDALSKEKTLPRRRWLTPDEVMKREPSLSRTGLVAAAEYA